ncbi:hypothetical protein [Ectopseudomonas oleovorans]|uniref:hypothetical protein n=1 Tax=Ectopseudomonas oleovorans TaxID=301 RepID=UPI0011C02EB1|nr:hypothetical protein [Pseudomonas oleovorans]
MRNDQNFISWLSGGMATASLALFLLAPTLDKNNQELVLIATHFLAASLPFLCAACWLSKDNDLSKSPNKNTTNIIAFLLTIGGIATLLGFFLICLSVAQSMAITLLLSIGATAILMVKSK